MNITFAPTFARTARQLWQACTIAVITTASLGASAAPGAHGPGGEHIDGPTIANAASRNPRIEAKSELFELVAQLQGGELVILVDRYDSNQPVLGAKLEIESGSLKATAAFRAVQGDYVVTDTKMLKALATPGEHALVFTLVSGTDSDLLDSTLITPKAVADAAHSQDDGHGHGLQRSAWTGAVLLAVGAIGAIGAIAWHRRRKRGAAATTMEAQS